MNLAKLLPDFSLTPEAKARLSTPRIQPRKPIDAHGEGLALKVARKSMTARLTAEVGR